MIGWKDPILDLTRRVLGVLLQELNDDRLSGRRQDNNWRGDTVFLSPLTTCPEKINHKHHDQTTDWNFNLIPSSL